MKRAEFEGWIEFYRQNPFDDLHRFHRPAALVASTMSGDLNKHLDWLCPPPEKALLERDLAGRSEVDKSIIRAFRAVGTKKRPPRKK